MLLVLQLEQSKQWDSIVRSFKKYDVYWLSGYVKAFQIHGDGVPLLFFYEDCNTRGMNVVMKRDIAEDIHFTGRISASKYFDFSSPYGYGGWLIEGEDAKGLFSAYENWCLHHRVISEFVRFHPMVGNHEACSGFYKVMQMGEVVHMDLDSSELIWNNITSKNRNVIRKAVRNNVRIYHGHYPEIYETFRSIYNATMDKDEAEDYYYFEPEFYTSVLDDIPQNAQVFYASKDGVIIAASIILTANGMMDYHLSGSLREFSGLAATNLLLYKAALWGTENGYKTFYLGGGVGSYQDSLFKFKKAFNRGESKHFYIGKKVFSQGIYEELLAMREPLKTGYFPEYRG